MKIFFDVMAPDIAGGGANIAQLMAAQGVKTEESNSVSVPTINTQGSEEAAAPPVEVPAKTETVQAAHTPVVPLPEPLKQEPVIQPAAVVEQPKPVEVDWKEVLKKQPEVEVMKVLGLDEKMINFLSRWKGGDDLQDYLEAVSTDYSKMNAEQVMRRYWRQEFGDIPAEDFEELYRMKVTEHYKLDPDVFDEKEVHRGKLLLNIEADKIRQQFVQKQQELLLTKPPAPPPSLQEQEAQAAQAEREKAVTEYRNQIEKDAFTQELLNKKLMTIGEGEDTFNYEVSQPQSLLEIIFDPQKWASKLYDANGAPNVRKHMLLAAIANDDVSFFNNYAKHHQRIGAKKAIEPIENASAAVGTPAGGNDLPKDPAAALARAGIITSGY